MAQRLATLDELCKVTKDFAHVQKEVLECFLEIAGADINVECWGGKASNGHIFLTAHMLQVAGWGEEAGERGPVNAEEIDKIKVSYSAVGTATGLDANYSTTKWGRLYLATKKTILIPGAVGRRFLWSC